jgi:head-tail adaptor
MWRDVIELGSVVETIVNGEVSRAITYRKVYANKKSVRSKEFYEARQIELKPELMFEVRSSEFSGEEKLKFNSKVYDIIRTYDKGEFMELICSVVK